MDKLKNDMLLLEQQAKKLFQDDLKSYTDEKLEFLYQALTDKIMKDDGLSLFLLDVRGDVLTEMTIRATLDKKEKPEWKN